MAAHLLHVPAGHDAPERVPDDGDPRSLRDAGHQLAQAAGDSPDADARGVRERRHARAGLALEASAQRAEDARARAEAVDEHDHGVSGPRFGNDRRQVAMHQRHLADQRQSFLADQLLEGNGESHLFHWTEACSVRVVDNSS